MSLRRKTPMLRSWIKRGTKGLQRGGSLKRHKRMKPVNAARAAKAERENFGDVARLVRRARCCRCGQPSISQAAHYVKRSRGGNKSHLVPLCWRCHREQEGRTAAFERDVVVHDMDGGLVRGFSFWGHVCETLAEVASYVVEATRDHVCSDWLERYGRGRKRRTRCYVCREPLDPDAEGIAP